MPFEGKHVYAVIMAGGTGSSMLWPCSRRRNPKQFIDLFGEGTMIESTVSRIGRRISPDRTYVVTSMQGREMMERALPEFPPENILVEPVPRDTAPCIALVTAYIKKKDPEAVTIVLPSDHLVLDEEAFWKILDAGVEIAGDRKSIVTIGVTPDRPETGYGYIQVERVSRADCLPPDGGISLYSVRAFAEKPDRATAQEFLDSGDFYWNSGIFIWHLGVISSEFERSMPDLYKDMQGIYDSLGTEKEREVIEDVYSWNHPVSIDSGVMEKAENVYMLAGDFGWVDLGSWDEVLKMKGTGTVPAGDPGTFVQVEAANNFVVKPRKKAVAIVGLDDIIIIETDDALLVCGKGQAHNVRKVVDALRREGFEEYL
ncbi:mannose-1-phosphate guanyltransferase [Prosthecochloris sp. GSB1]|uniref:mannose-1-phosphate guanylyltransferase n=1 Tax=Prosthecochloris sp. GSB1 TaxID=281093 RepID=UPI000B8D01FE|nr:mannose-1-phosphate guanylyltransferase [Prosthecochloris sp. GSB1]ASQ91324.1 mannose-1-phosphate guanyltransferase [Prosthecochloris sp. GSB1]